MNTKLHQHLDRPMIALLPEEYDLFDQFSKMRPILPGGSSKFFCFSRTAGPCNRLLECFQECWKGLGLPWAPTFSMIRTSLSTYVGRQLTERQMLTVRRLMCHSQATAEAFYEAQHGLDQAFQARKLTEKAIQNEQLQRHCTEEEEEAEEERTGFAKTPPSNRKRTLEQQSSEAKQRQRKKEDIPIQGEDKDGPSQPPARAKKKYAERSSLKARLNLRKRKPPKDFKDYVV